MSHEMRTPLATAIFFLSQLIMILQNPSSQVSRYMSLMMSQLTLVQSFVEDLLDMRQFKDGVLTLVKDSFNPNEVLDLVQSIFEPQTKAKNIKIVHRVQPGLRAPDEHEA